MALGLTLLAFTPLVIFWNEHFHVKIAELYDAAQKAVCNVDVDCSGGGAGYTYGAVPKTSINDDLDAQFVCVSGKLQGGTTLRDPVFPSEIVVENALLLVREIEIYQYIESYDKRDGTWNLKKQWCKFPQPDLQHFKNKKNPIGNWNLLAGDQMMDTGSTLNGEPIQFPEGICIFRASDVRLGNFVVPPSLMDEGFFGTRHVQRLHELQRLKDLQGTWTEMVPRIQSSATVSHGHMSNGQYVYDGKYVYDGVQDGIGTIRMKWRYAPCQTVTIAAEAVSPGRVCMNGYGCRGQNLSDTNPNKYSLMKKMILSDLFAERLQDNGQLERMVKGNVKLERLKSDKVSNLLLNDVVEDQSCSGPTFMVNSTHWTFSTFVVSTKRSWLPFFVESRDEYLGRLWLFAPGTLSASQLFRKAHWANDKMLWMLRGLTVLSLYIGWVLALDPLTDMFGWGFLKTLMAFAVGLVAVFLATSCWTVCTALACITARPVQSILFVSCAFGIFVYLNHQGKEIEY